MPEITKKRMTAAMAASVRIRYIVVFEPVVLTDSQRSFIVCVAETLIAAKLSLRASVSSSG